MTILIGIIERKNRRGKIENKGNAGKNIKIPTFPFEIS